MSKHLVLIEAKYKPQDIVALRVNPKKIFVVSAYRVLSVDEAGKCSLLYYEVYDEEGRGFDFTEQDLELIEEYKSKEE